MFLTSFVATVMTILTQFRHQICTSLMSNLGGIKFQSRFLLRMCDLDTVLWSPQSDWSGSAASLVQIIAVTAAGPIVALTKLPDPTTSLHHHLLRHRHHNAEEVGILERCGRQTEDRLLSHQPFSEVNIVFKVWEVIHVNSHHDVHGS